MSIRDFLEKKRYPHAVRVQLKQHPEQVLHNGQPALLRTPLLAGDELQIRILERASSDGIRPMPIPLSICYEDEDLLLINKPAGLPVHPSQNHYLDTLANGICNYYQHSGEPFVFRCINRLDKDTSGLLLIAKNMLSGAILSQDIKNRQIHRTYLAIVSGHLPEGENGTIDAPIGRAEHSTILRRVDPQAGQRAVTHYRVLRALPDRSLVELWLETGRTHQIRVHMTSIGHPLMGDDLYHPQAKDDGIPRQALHSCALEFSHPISGAPMRFYQPLPDDMQALLST